MRLRYHLRRFVIVLARYDHIACTVPTCPEPQVGISVWCREHTDQILEHRQSAELTDCLESIHRTREGSTR